MVIMLVKCLITVIKWVFSLFSVSEKHLHWFWFSVCEVFNHFILSFNYVFKKKQQIWPNYSMEDRGEFVWNFFAVIILAVLFGWTEMAFKDKRQPRAPYGEYRNDYNCLYLIINKTLFPADRRSSRSCKKQNAHFLVFTCLYMV